MTVKLSEFSNEIANHNADGMCAQEACSNKPTKHYELKIKEMTYYLPVCDDHDEFIFQSMKN